MSTSQNISSQSNKVFRHTPPSVRTTEIFGKAISKAIILFKIKAEQENKFLK